MNLNKVAKKKHDGKCFFCGEADYVTLDLHRIVEGKNGGKYTRHNTITTCCLCHRKIHGGQIKIDRWYPSTSGKRVLHYWKDSQEFWINE